MKYIVFADIHDQEYPIIFPEILNHIDMANCMKRMTPTLKPISAGFASINGCDIRCFDRSESLRLDSRPDEDARIIKFHQLHMSAM